VCCSNLVREIFDFKNAMTLKTGLYVCQGHWKCHHSIERIWLPNWHSIIIVALSLVVSEIFNVEKYCDLEIWVMGQSRSLNVVPFDSMGRVSFWCFIVTCPSYTPFLRYLTCNYTVTLKPGLGVSPGHWNRHGSIRRLWLPVKVPEQPCAYLVPFPK